MSGKHAALRAALEVAKDRHQQARSALDVALQVAAPTEREAAHDALGCYMQAHADLKAALIADRPHKVGEVYRSRTGVVATVVSHNVDLQTKSVTTWGGVHKKDGKMGVKRIILWKNEWAGAVKLETEVAA